MSTAKRRTASLLERDYCTARKSNGDPCRQRPIRGGSVCRYHGGSAPQVLAKAKERITANADRAAKQLIELMEDETTPPAVKLNAARDLLDRAGLTPAQVIQHSLAVKPWEQLISGGLDRTRPTGGAPAIEPPIVDAEVIEDPDPEDEPELAKRASKADRRRAVAEVRRRRRERT